MQSISMALLAAVTVAGPLATVPQNDSGLVLRAVRFYRPDQNRTRVKGLVQIPFSMIQQSSGAAGYTVSVRVVDSTGLTLYQQSRRVSTGSKLEWRTRCRAGRLREGSTFKPSPRRTARLIFWLRQTCAWPRQMIQCRGQASFAPGTIW